MRVIEQYQAGRARRAVEQSIRELLDTQEFVQWQKQHDAEIEAERNRKEKFLQSLTPAATEYLIGMEKLRLQEKSTEYRPLIPFTD